MFLASLESFDTNITMWAASLGWPGEGLLRLGLAVLLGGLVGMEREVRGRQAGFRTYLLVCVGAALAMVVSIHFARVAWPTHPGVNINIDPARIAYGIMAGIGFLGAGTILHSKGQIRGLTTAAGLWCVCAVGLAIGFGLYTLAILATVMILAALWILDYVEDWIPKVRYRTVTLRCIYKPGCIAETVATFKQAKLDVIDASFERTTDLTEADISLRIAFITREQYYNFERDLEKDHRYRLIATREL